MNIKAEHSNIITRSADCLVYSTNPELNPTGGVGKALAELYGIDFYKAIPADVLLSPGEVVSFAIDGAPWKKIYATCVVDNLYHVSIEAISTALNNIFNQCHQQNIVMGCLGCGYGDLEVTTFVDILAQAVENYNPQSVTLCEIEQTQYVLLAKYLKQHNCHA